MHHITIDNIDWERIQVRLRGRVHGEDAATVIAQGRFFFLEGHDRELMAPVEHVTAHGHEFCIRFNPFSALDLYPLKMGDWTLYFESEDGKYRPVQMCEGFGIDVRDYKGLFGTWPMKYWVLPTAGPKGQFRLSVNHRSEPRTDTTSRGARITKLIKSYRDQAFIALYRMFRTTSPADKPRVLFTSDSRSELSGNLLVIHDRMIERGLDQQFKIMMSFKPSITAKRGLLDKFRFTKFLASADIVLMDDYQPMIYKVDFPEHVKIIQVWHASGAFKTVGYSRIGKPGGQSPFSTGHKKYTHAIVSSEHDIPYYAEAFGIREKNVIPTGIPRMDIFFDEKYRAETRDRMHEAFPDTKDRMVVLFAPTFRGQGPSDAFYDYDRIDFEGLYELACEKDAVVIFKMHPFVIEPLEIPEHMRDRFIDAFEYREINDFLFIADLVITDYSSLVFEYSILDKPMLFFAYDLEEYVSTRDFYGDFDEFVPGKIVPTFDELLEAIRNGDYEQNKVRSFARKHFGHLDGGSTDRVIDQIILGD